MQPSLQAATGPREQRIFLTAEWRYLAMLNYVVDSGILAALVPRGTELDLYHGQSYVSIVGFLFLKARVLGIPIPGHCDFEEINLRFYVRRRLSDGSWRRATVFIREIVPRLAIAWAARTIYNEPYLALPTHHEMESGEVPYEAQRVRYAWRFRGREHAVTLKTNGTSQAMREGSEEEFIAEHYYGYTSQRDGTTLEYRVEHPRWEIQPALEAHLDCDVAALYGRKYCEALNARPTSAFLAKGSKVQVFRGLRIA